MKREFIEIVDHYVDAEITQLEWLKLRAPLLPAWEAAIAEQEAGLLAELAEVGIQTTSIWLVDVKQQSNYDQAMPILLRHFDMPYHIVIREGIARRMKGSAAREYWDQLVALFRNEPPPPGNPPGKRGLTPTGDPKQGLAVALSETATPSHLDDVIKLFCDPANGTDRIFFVKNLMRSKSPKAMQALRSMLHDPEVATEIRARFKQRKIPI